MSSVDYFILLPVPSAHTWLSTEIIMTWFYGFEFKWRHVRRFAEEMGFYDGNVSNKDFNVQVFLKEVTKVLFWVRPDYSDHLILSFHQSHTKGDL